MYSDDWQEKNLEENLSGLIVIGERALCDGREKSKFSNGGWSIEFPSIQTIFTQFIIATSRPLMIPTVEILTSAYPNNPKIILAYFHQEIIKI